MAVPPPPSIKSRVPPPLIGAGAQDKTDFYDKILDIDIIDPEMWTRIGEKLFPTPKDKIAKMPLGQQIREVGKGAGRGIFGIPAFGAQVLTEPLEVAKQTPAWVGQTLANLSGAAQGMPEYQERLARDPLSPLFLASISRALTGKKTGQPARVKKAGEPARVETPKLAEMPKAEPMAEMPKAEATGTHVQRIAEALKEVTPIRLKQEKSYTKERAERFAESEKVFKKIGGEKGLYAAKAKLKGEYTRVQFEGLKEKISQADLDALIEDARTSPYLTYPESLGASDALASLFVKGKLPRDFEIAYFKKVFPEEFVKAISGETPSMFKKFAEWGLQLANLPRTIMSSFLDLSFGLRQGVFLAPKFRKEFYDSFKKQFGWFAHEAAFQAVMDGIKVRPNYNHMRGRVSFTELGTKMGLREEPFVASWAEHIPIAGRGVRATARAYTAFANKYRADVFDTLFKQAESLGLEPANSAKWRRGVEGQKGYTDNIMLDSIANLVNLGSGRGGLGSLENAALVLNAFFFSPRLMSSRIQLLTNPKLYINKSTPAFARKAALESLFEFTGTWMTILGVAKGAGLEVGLDPRSSDFLKIIVGDTRIDVGGGFQQYIRMAAQFTSGQYISSTTGKLATLGEGYKPLTRLGVVSKGIESKEAPIFSLITTLMKGQGFAGEPLNIPKEVGNRFVPMVIGDLIDLAKDNPKLLPVGALAVFGVGLQTYGIEGEKLTQEQKKRIFEISKQLGEQSRAKDVIKQAAIALEKKLQKMPEEEALKELKLTDDKVREKVIDILSAKERGLTYEERLLKDLSLKSGARREAILKVLGNFPTKEKQLDYIRNLKNKEIIDRIEFNLIKGRIQKGISK